MRQRNAVYKKASEDFGSCVCVAKDENGVLLSGQNPASAGDLAKALLKELNI